MKLKYALLVMLAACASSNSSGNLSTTPPNPDPRVGLKGGLRDAATAAWNLRLLSTTPTEPKLLNGWASDLAFSRNYVVQGNFNGWEVWDISNPAKPTSVTSSSFY